MTTELEKIMEMWKIDSDIDETDETNLGQEVLRNTKLHSKYLNFMIDHRLKAKALEIKYQKEKIFKIGYYLGHFNTNEEVLKSRNLEPMRERILKSAVQNYLDGDDALLEILMKKTLEDEIVSYCEEVIKALKDRGYSINAAIKFHIFKNGG